VADTLERTDERTEQWQQTVLERPWVTIVWNDPVNLVSYVEWIFRTYFGFDRTEAHRLTMLVHNEGKAVVASGTREEMERHVTAMHGFGLWATLQKDEA
jgi:ATP-dependent Clp protease adaptor protein ClpS